MAEKPTGYLAPAYARIHQRIADVLRPLGYAAALHGSMANDLDIVAVPWTDEAGPAHEVLWAVQKVVGYFGTENRELFGPTQKPHGRTAWKIILEAGCAIDLSVMPLDYGLKNDQMHIDIQKKVRMMGYVAASLTPLEILLAPFEEDCAKIERILDAVSGIVLDGKQGKQSTIVQPHGRVLCTILVPGDNQSTTAFAVQVMPPYYQYAGKKGMLELLDSIPDKPTGRYHEAQPRAFGCKHREDTTCEMCEGMVARWQERRREENDTVLVPRNLVAAACHVIRRSRPESKTLERLSHIAIHGPTITADNLPKKE